MNLRIKVEWLANVPSRRQELKQYTEYNPKTHVDIRADRFTDAELDALEGYLKGLNGAGHDVRSCLSKIKVWRKTKENVDGTKIYRLDQLEAVLRELIRPTPNRWLFKRNADGWDVPYYVAQIEYVQGRKTSYTPACVRMTLCAILHGNPVQELVNFFMDDLGMPAMRVLEANGLILATDARVSVYNAQLETYNAIAGECGTQYAATGYALYLNSYSAGHGQRSAAMVHDDGPKFSRVVLDDGSKERGEGRAKGSSVTVNYWEEHDADDEVVVVPPVHPYVRIFDFRRDCFLSIHAELLEPYAYNEGLADRLILPKAHKEVIAMAISGADRLMDDIIEGKSGGVICLCTGEPGTGKTLTAQVFSEHLRRPLYMVQCAQLGISPEELERNLERVLDRAERWNAILLVDEADVYIHARGSDIEQNAVVGVMLRTLESYRGVLFLTCNRGAVIDDAIISRVTIHIPYTIPDEAMALKIWRVLAANYRIEFTEAQLSELATTYKGISGRSIKTILKLARLVEEGKVTLDLIRRVSDFVPTEAKPQRP